MSGHSSETDDEDEQKTKFKFVVIHPMTLTEEEFRSYVTQCVPMWAVVKRDIFTAENIGDQLFRER